MSDFDTLRELISELPTTVLQDDDLQTLIDTLEKKYSEALQDNDELMAVYAVHLVCRMGKYGNIVEVLDRSISPENRDENYREFWLKELKDAYEDDIDQERLSKDEDYLEKWKQVWVGEFPQDEEDSMLVRVLLHTDGIELYEVVDDNGYLD